MGTRRRKDIWLSVLTKLIDDVVKANEMLAVTTIINAKMITFEDPYKREIIDREIATAEGEIAKAYDEVAKERPGQAINRFKLAWKHAQHAILIGTEEPAISERKEKFYSRPEPNGDRYYDLPYETV